MKKTSKKIVQEYMGESPLNFKSEKHLQKFIRKEGKAPDYVLISGILYTMDEYDSSGRQITYYNKRTGLGFLVETRNRYGDTGFTDAVVEEPYDVDCWRIGFNYAD